MGEAWESSLIRYNADNGIDEPIAAREEEVERDTQKEFTAIFKGIEEKELKTDPSLKAIPRFFFKTPNDDDVLQQKLRKAARGRFLHKKSQDLLSSEDLEVLWELLQDNTSRPMDAFAESRMNYDGFCAVASQLDPVLARKCEEFFTPSTFLKFEQDKYGRISIQSLFEFIARKVSLLQTRISLSIFDASGKGYLRENDLENYLFELTSTLRPLAGLEDSFKVFYICTAVRKFFFFLDPMRLGRIAIKDMLLSPILVELFELREEGFTPEMERTNWFSASYARRIYADYLALDLDHNGMLSRQELAAYGNSTLTDAFLDRLFEECHTYEGEMDYKTYLDFVLSMENKAHPASLAYFFRLLDAQKQGFITASTINYFFKDVLAKMAEAGYDLVNPDDVKDEVFDMTRPADPYKITLDDLIKSKVGETVISILTDVSGFWCYDNREMLVASEEQDNNSAAAAAAAEAAANRQRQIDALTL